MADWAACSAALLLLVSGARAASPDFFVQVAEPAAWRSLLDSIGLEATRQAARYRITVGDSEAARAAGVVRTRRALRVASLVSARDPETEIFWEDPVELPVYEVPDRWRVFTREKHSGAPLMAGSGELLWVAAAPGERGYERFPYLLHALVDLGLRPPFRGARAWALFDSSYRLRADPAYLARRWRKAGLAAMHVAAWHFFDSDPVRTAYLKQLIEACRREGLLVYAWLELPHVSEGFWRESPECREKTATLEDAKLDWRKLINLADPDCSRAVEEGVAKLLTRFDWDGANLAELYFESLHGPSAPARFTPLNRWVRADAERELGFDPLELFDESSPLAWARSPNKWRQFADYRARLALALQLRWLRMIRRLLPDGELIVTQIDDRLDPRMRDYLGADAGALLPFAEQLRFTLMIEDPATLWDRGPRRYAEIAARYRPSAPDPRRLAIDINIVERYQQTYPTRKQVGGELLQLLRTASRSFARTALYFEHSIGRPDWKLLPFALHSAQLVSRSGDGRVTVEAERWFGLNWRGPARVDGALWPLGDGKTLWLPPGRRTVEPSVQKPRGRILEINLEIEGVRVEAAHTVRIDYRSSSPGFLLLDRQPVALILDGRPARIGVECVPRGFLLRPPSGAHRIEVRF